MPFIRSKIVSVAMISLVVLCLSANILLYLQLQTLQTEINDLNSRISQIQGSADKTIHTVKLGWVRESIEGETLIEGYVRSWTTNETIRILQVTVWMGKPYNITWEGDAS